MDSFEWKPVGERWRGAGIYLLTLVVQGRKPLPGSLALTLEGKPYVRRSALGMAVADEFLHIGNHYPQVKTLVFQVMPDHFNGGIHAQQELPVSVRVLVRGFKQGCNRRWREQQGNGEETRAYQNRCILAARAGAVLTGAFISKAEKAILDQAHREGFPSSTC